MARVFLDFLGKSSNLIEAWAAFFVFPQGGKIAQFSVSFELMPVMNLKEGGDE